MNRRLSALLFAAALTICWPSWTDGQQIRAYFSPRQGLSRAIIDELDKAKTSIDIANYQLSYRPIGQAIAAAQKRGLAIRIVLDPAQEGANSPLPRMLRAANVQQRTDHKENLQHNKYAIIDGHLLITGSANWSANAEERNAENIVIIDDASTAAAFATDFEKHWQHSSPYKVGEGRARHRTPPPIPPFPPNTSPRAKDHQ